MTGMLLTWVEADPSSERAIDALGLAVQADRIADELLPDLSVGTRRARYLSFLCWAVDKAGQMSDPERLIRQLEAKLALHEARVHEGSDKVCLGIVGRTVIASYLKKHNNRKPGHPERLYKSSAFWNYRPLMRSLDLLDQGEGIGLTDRGRELARSYGNATGGRPQCLRRISPRERNLIRVHLGLVWRGKTTPAQKCRRLTFEELSRHFAGKELTPQLVLPRYRRRPSDSASPVLRALHKAHVWEALSLGLNLAFVALIDRGSVAACARDLTQALRSRQGFPVLRSYEATEGDAPARIVGLLRYARSLRVRDLVADGSADDIAAELVVQRRPREFLKMLVRRHEAVKGGDAWFRLVDPDGRVKRLASERKILPMRADLHPYRLNAFWELMTDLGRWK